MPTYEYRCDACGHAFEEFQSMSAAPIRKCPKCKKSKVKRLIGTGAGLIFKGSGFYITDYRDQSYTDKAKAESGTGSGETTKSDSSGGSDSSKSTDAKPAATESKPAAKSEKPSTSSKSASKESSKKKGK